ncbi:MAG: dicarboxylate/amino acid:cation symporter [Spirochaetales bacterium]|nr:dicarboxylate/amino acid:cation symporter [Spirochaetales bacterium]
MNNTESQPFLVRFMKNPLMLIAAILAGIYVGFVAPEWSKRIAPLGLAYLHLLQLAILPLIVVSLITTLGSSDSSQKHRISFLRVILIALLFLLAVSALSLALSLVFQPGRGLSESSRITLGKTLFHADQTGMKQNIMETKPSILSRFIPSEIFGFWNHGHGFQLIILAILFGLSLRRIGKEHRTHILHGTSSLFKAFFSMAEWITILLPVALFVFVSGQVSELGFPIILALGKLLIVLGTISAIIFVLSAILISISLAVNPGRVIWALGEAIVIGFGTQSAVYAAPAIIRGLTKKLGAERNATTFTVSLGVVVFRFSLAILFAISIVFAAQLYEIPLHAGSIFLGILLVVGASLLNVGNLSMMGLASLSLVFSPLGLPSSPILILLMVSYPLLTPLTAVVEVMAIAATASAAAGKQPVITEGRE